MKRLIWLLLTWLLAFAAPSYSQVPNSEYLEAKDASTAVILAHGRGQGPDGQVVGALRRAIHAEAGFHTLSVQLPVLATPDYLAYAATYPDAYKTLQSAIDFLVKQKGVRRIYVMGYSLGARMTTSFLANHPAPQVVGYIGVGVLEGGGELLDANLNIGKLSVPVIDLYADSTPLDLKSAVNRQALVGDRYKQVQIRGANHSFRGYDAALAEAIMPWLKGLEQRQ
ncbi:MAG: alpha/beta hydrolase [Polaromonas sp.]